MTYRIVRGCVLGAALVFAGTAAFAEDPPWPRRAVPGPISDWHKHQPTQGKLDEMHVQDVPANQAQEVDRLYDQLLASSERILRDQPALTK
jgi:hypothetical protein